MQKVSRLASCCSRVYVSQPTSQTPHIGAYLKLSLASMSTTSQTRPKLSDGQDESKLLYETDALIEKGWQLDEELMGVQKTYFFKTYTKALDFVQMVGIRSKSKSHHSVMTVRTGSVDIHWTTHHPRGLSDKDTFMAQYCDERAKEIGTVERSDALKCAP